MSIFIFVLNSINLIKNKSKPMEKIYMNIIKNILPELAHSLANLGDAALF